jgi:hypothetical protein
MVDTTTTPTAPASTSAPTQNNPQLQLGDILLATQALQLASARGAFKVEEFTQVGGVYERLIAFLQSAGAIQPAANSTVAP